MRVYGVVLLSVLALSNMAGVVCRNTDGSLVFDEAGNLAAAANDFAVSRFAHDDCHRVVRAETLVGQELFDTIWRRDAGGLVTNLVSGGRAVFSAAYDSQGRLASLNGGA